MYGTDTSVSSGGTGTPQTAPNAYGAQNVATVGAQPPPAAYATELEAAYAPFFQQQQQALNANQAATGTLTSGAGNYGQQQLAAQDAATLAQGELPLIEQGNQNQFSANSQNASAINSFLSLLQGQGFQAGQTNQQDTLTQNLANQGYYNNALTGNVASQNAYQTNSQNIAGGNYSSILQELYGLLSGGQSGLSNIYSGASGLETNAQQTGAASGAQAGAGIGTGIADLLPQLLAGGGG